MDKSKDLKQPIDYIKSLDLEVQKRYVDKIRYIGNCDPYKVDPKEFEKVRDGQGLGKGEAALPPITFGDLFIYLISGISPYTQQELRNYKSLLAYNQFLHGFVRDVRVKKFEESGNVVVRGLVMHSQQLRDKPLDCWIIADNSGTVLCGHCTCIAGLNECCTHVGALLFYIEYAVRFRETVSCTGVKAKWVVPITKTVSYYPVWQADISTAETKKKQLNESLKGETIPPKNLKSDIRKQKDVPSITNDEFEVWCAEFFEANPESGIFSILPNFQSGFIPKCLNSKYPPVLSELFEEEKLNFAFNELLAYCQTINVDFSQDQANVAEKDTKLQSKNKLWQQLRAGRITASTFKNAVSTDPAMPSISLVNLICYPNSHNFQTEATKWGSNMENTARIKYKDYMIGKHQNFRVTNSGLWLNSAYPFLGASPDGLLDCTCCGKGTLEIKCPFTMKDKSAHEEHRNSCLRNSESGYVLDKKHSYYYQIQVQLFVTESRYADFCIWTNVDMHVERIKPDMEFWKENVGKAEKIFRCAILPELVGKFYSKGVDEPTLDKDEATCDNAKATADENAKATCDNNVKSTCDNNVKATCDNNVKANCDVNANATCDYIDIITGDKGTRDENSIPDLCIPSTTKPSFSGTKMVLSSITNKKSKKKVQTWCYCKGPDEGSMIGCDGENCRFQWFHTDCLKIDKIPRGKWYCPDCAKLNRVNKKRKEKK